MMGSKAHHSSVQQKVDDSDLLRVPTENDHSHRSTKAGHSSHSGPNWRALIIEALKYSAAGPLTKNEICRAIQAKHPINTFGVRAQDWTESVRLVLGKGPGFYKSRGTGTIKWGLEAQHTTVQTESENEDAVPVLSRVKSKHNAKSRHFVHKGPNWRTLITEALEASQTGLLTSRDVRRAIETQHPIHTLGVRSKDWKTSVQCVLSKDSAFYKSGRAGKVKWGLASRRIIADTEREDDKTFPPAPLYIDGKHRWAELASGVREEDIYSDVDSNASDPHVVDDKTGSWSLRKDSKVIQQSSRRRQQADLVPRLEAQFSAVNAAGLGAHDLLTPRERVLIPMAMQWLIKQGTEAGEKVDPAPLFAGITHASFLPELTRTDALNTTTAAANLLQGQILKADEDRVTLPSNG